MTFPMHIVLSVKSSYKEKSVEGNTLLALLTTGRRLNEWYRGIYECMDSK